MADHELKRVARRAPTPIPGGRETGGTHALPEELLEEQVYRLALLSAVVAGLWTLAVFIDVVLAPWVWGKAISRESLALDITWLAVALFMLG